MNSTYLNLFGSINDPIHGSIKMSKEETKVIGQALFRRLHHVRQNSFLYKVFPSAKHTRFEHSIGAMHLSSKILTALIENGESASEANDLVQIDKIESVLKETSGVGFNLYKIEDKSILDKAFREVRLAALLHDIGHGPLSHLFDAFAPTTEEFVEILKSDKVLRTEHFEIFNALSEMLERYKEKEIEKYGNKESDIRIEHEHVSSYFTYSILRNVLEDDPDKDIIIRNVLTILKPELNLGTFDIKIENLDIDILPLLNDIVASAPIDCDRMDYLKRDSYFAGVPYGNYSEDRILKSFIPFLTFEDGNFVARLGLKQSGLHSIENFLQARYEMFVQVYGHKTNEACNFMLEELEKTEAKKFQEWTKIGLNAQEFEGLYIKLTDETFLEKLSETLGGKGKETVNRLVNRDLWKRVYEVEEFVIKETEDLTIKEIMEEKIEELKTLDTTLKLFKGDRFPLKDFENAAKILGKNSYPFYTVSDTPLKNASQIIESLNKGLRVWRIYTLQNVTQELKESARENIHPEIKRIKDRGIVH